MRITGKVRVLLACVSALGVCAALPASGYATSGVDGVAWGQNTHVELDAGYIDNLQESPVAMLQEKIVEVATGKQFSIALLESGKVVAWGINERGELGDDSGERGNNESSWEKGVNDSYVGEIEKEGKWEGKPLEGVKEVAAHGEHAIALLTNGKVVTWGDNEWGQLGNGLGGFEDETHEDQRTPKEVVGKEGKGELKDVTMVAAGGEDDFAVEDEGKEMMAWGGNKYGQLGTNEAVSGPEKCTNEQGEKVGEHHEEPCATYPRPVDLPSVVTEGSAHITAVSVMGLSTYILLSNGQVWAWGENPSGQIGDNGSTKNSEDISNTPQEVKYLGEVEGSIGTPVALAAGVEHVLALLSNGEVAAWGDDEMGELGGAAPEECQGKDPCSKVPRKIEGVSGVSSIAAGQQDSFLVKSGKVYAFGKDSNGELGIGTRTESALSTPTLISGLEHVKSVSAGNLHTNALLESGYSPPTPLATLTPGVDSLTLKWTLEDSEYKTREALFNPEKPLAPEWSKATVFSATENKHDYEIKEFTYSELTPVRHEVKLVGGEEELVMQATPEE